MTTESVVPAQAAAGATSTDIPAVVRKLRATFATGRTRSVQWRKEQLHALERLMTENEGAIAEALEKDLGRAPFEAWLADIASTTGEAAYAAKNVGKWMKRRYRLLEMSQLPGRGWVEYEPYGTVLVIGAWNFPFALTLGPAVGAIAAGNTVVLKPSEVAPASSAVMAELVPRYLDNDAVAVVEGDGTSQPPAEDAAVELVDFGFASLPAELPAGKLTIKATNSGTEMHELIVISPVEGFTAEDIVGMLTMPPASPEADASSEHDHGTPAPEESGPPPFNFNGGLQGIMPGMTGYAIVDLAPGEYIAFCGIPSPANGGAPHFMLGMYAIFNAK